MQEKQTQEGLFATLISHLIVGLTGAVKWDLGDPAVGWADDVLRDHTPGKERQYFLLSDDRGFGIIAYPQIGILMKAPGWRPSLVLLRMGADRKVEYMKVNGAESPVSDETKRELSLAVSALEELFSLASAERCPQCGREYDMGTAQKFCDKCGQPKA